MGERQKYNLKQELLALNDDVSGKNDGKNKVLSLQGISALTKPDYNNSMRTTMYTSHSRQFVTLCKPDFPKVYFGAENVVGKYSSGYKKVDGNKVVYRKVVKYEKLIEDSDYIDEPQTYLLFLYDKEEDMYTVVTRKPCEDLTELFGYDYVNSEIDKYDEGDTIEDQTVLFKSSSYDENMNYRYGRNVPVMYTLDPTTFEDAAAFSDDLAESLINPEVETVTIGLNDNDYLLNMFGDKDHYKTLPEIGQRVNGILAVSRRQFNNQLLFDFRNSNLDKIIDGDSVYFETGVVLDYTIYCNNPDMPDTSFNKDILRYLKHQKKYWKEIHDTCEAIINSGSSYHNDINYLYKRAQEMLDTEKRWKEGDSSFSNVEIQVLIRRAVNCQPGQKFSPRYGNKSVISKIIPKDEMPYYYDEDGNRVHAQVLINLLAIINRTTAYPMYEIAENFIANKAIRKLKTIKSRKKQEKLLFELLCDFDNRYGVESKEIYDSLTEDEKDAYMDDVINGNGIFIRDIPFQEEEYIFNRIMNIFKKYDWLKPDQVYIRKWGMEIPCLSEYRIGDMYIMKLKQTSRKNFSVRSMGAINSKNLPERSYKSRAHLEKNPSTAIRFGEYETLNFSIGQETDDHALFHALYRTSIKGREDLSKIAMDPTKDEGDIADTYDSRTAEIFNVILKSLSLGTKFYDDDNVLRDFSKKQSSYVIGNTCYLCDEFTAAMLQRVYDTEQSILKEHPVMDKNELYDMVRDIMLSGKKLVGLSTEKEVDEILALYYN